MHKNTKLLIKGVISIGIIIALSILIPLPGHKNYNECRDQVGAKKNLCNKLYREKEKWDQQEELREKAYNKYVKPHEEQRAKHGENAKAIREELYLIDTKPAPVEPIVEDFISRATENIGIPYKLGGKSEKSLDCSGLFTLYGYEHGIVSEYYKNYLGNAHNLFTKKTAPVDKPSRGNIVYFKAKGNYANHIAMITRVIYSFPKEMGLEIIDASGQYGLSKRFITVVKNNKGVREYPLKEDGSRLRYDVYFATNPILSFQRESILLEKPTTPTPMKNENKLVYGKDDVMYFTRYDLGSVEQNDETPCIGASGQDLCTLAKEGIQTMALTKDMRIKYGVEFRDWVTLEGDPGCAGTYQVHDEMNCRFRGANAHDNGTCYNTKGGIADGNVLRPGTEYYIKGDVAAYGDHQPTGGACYIKEVIKV